MEPSLILSLQVNRNWTHQLLVYDVDVTVSGDNNYNKEKQKCSIRRNQGSWCVSETRMQDKIGNGKIGPVLNETPRYENIRESTAVAPRSLHFGSTVELHLSGSWLSASPITRIGLAIRINLSKI